LAATVSRPSDARRGRRRLLGGPSGDEPRGVTELQTVHYPDGYRVEILEMAG